MEVMRAMPGLGSVKSMCRGLGQRGGLLAALLAAAIGQAATAQEAEVPALTALGLPDAPTDPNADPIERGPLSPPILDAYELWWTVVGSEAQTVGHVDDPMPMRANARVLYEGVFGRNPRNLAEVVGELDGGEGRWKQNYLEFLDSHLTAIRQYLVEHPIPSEQAYMVAIDWESFNFSYEAQSTFNGGGGEDRWRAAVREINTPTLDQEFLSFVRFQTTAQSWDELVLFGQDEPLIRQSYNAVVRDYVLRSLHICRLYSPPETGWGFYGYPSTAINVQLDRGIETRFVRMNDELAWLWQATDFMAPTYYRMPYRDTQDTYGPQFRSSLLAEVERYYEINLEEAKRARDLYAPNSAILPFVWYFYHEAAPITVGTGGFQFLTPDNALAQFLYTREHGADGLLLWGVVSDYYVQNDGHRPLDEVLEYLDSVWDPAFKEVEDYLEQQGNQGGGGNPQS